MLRLEPQTGRFVTVATPDGPGHQVAIPRLPGVGRLMMLGIRPPERWEIDRPARRPTVDIVEVRHDVQADAPTAEHALDLVQPLVHEPFLRVESVRVAGPAVAHDRREPRTARRSPGTDAAAPAAQRSDAVTR